MHHVIICRHIVVHLLDDEQSIRLDVDAAIKAILPKFSIDEADVTIVVQWELVFFLLV